MRKTVPAGVQIAPDAVAAWNPAFDVTPAELVTGGYVTELGTFAKTTDLPAL